MRVFILLVLVFMFSQYANAQSDSTATKNGEVIDGEIVIEKEKKIILPKANKIFKQADIRSFDSESLQLDFIIFKPSFDWPNYKSEVPFQKANRKYPIAPFQNYVKVGFGNYISPLVEVSVSKKIEKIKFRASLFHESFARGPIDDEFSGSSRSMFDFTAKYESKTFSISPYLEINNDKYNFYGNANRINTGFSSEAPDEVRYNFLALGTFLNGRKKSLKYYLKVEAANDLQKLKDSFDLSKEPYFETLGGFSIKIDTSFSTGLDFEGYYSNYSSGISYTRSLIQAAPWVRYKKNDLDVKAGFRIASSESLNVEKSGLYPFLDLKFRIHPDWEVNGFVDGGFDRNNLDRLIAQNEFLDDSLLILNKETHLRLGGRVYGTPIENVRIGVESSYSTINDLPFFVPSSQDSSRFTIIYDNDKIEKFNAIIDASYSPNSTSTYSAKLEFSSYSLNSLDEPWHLPIFQMSLNSVHNINHKVIFLTEFVSLSGIESPTNSNSENETLQAIFDLNIGVKYLITNRSSVFFNANNLFNNKYERYIGYPVRGASFKIGGKYRF